MTIAAAIGLRGADYTGTCQLKGNHTGLKTGQCGDVQADEPLQSALIWMAKTIAISCTEYGILQRRGF